MDLSSPEQAVIENPFGIVTNRRVTYMAMKGWFSGGRREDVPLKQVVSVRCETNRSIFWGLFYVVVGLATIAFIVGVVPLAFGVLILWGSPRVNVITAGGTAAPVSGWPWQKQEAEAFASALRSQLFDE